jgi:hypothetical protein
MPGTPGFETVLYDSEAAVSSHRKCGNEPQPTAAASDKVVSSFSGQYGLLKRAYGCNSLRSPNRLGSHGGATYTKLFSGPRRMKCDVSRAIHTWRVLSIWHE